MIVWCVAIYFILSLIVMDIAKPQNDEYPVSNTILCFFIGGLILIVATLMGVYLLIFNRPKGKDSNGKNLKED